MKYSKVILIPGVFLFALGILFIFTRGTTGILFLFLLVTGLGLLISGVIRLQEGSTIKGPGIMSSILLMVLGIILFLIAAVNIPAHGRGSIRYSLEAQGIVRFLFFFLGLFHMVLAVVEKRGPGSQR